MIIAFNIDWHSYVLGSCYERGVPCPVLVASDWAYEPLEPWEAGQLLGGN